MSNSTKKQLALKEFGEWLPGELAYSASKAGYDKKVRRAGLPLCDGQSIHKFLGEEWFQFRRAESLGFHHHPEHAKSAQLQGAKFAAGIFDKLAVGRWAASGDEPNTETFLSYADSVATEVQSVRPWQHARYGVEEVLDMTFEESPFSRGIVLIAEYVTELANNKSNARPLTEVQLRNQVLVLGGLATACYAKFAVNNLDDSQLVLPKSLLATS